MTNHQSPIYIADYNYPLPDERIAKYPLAERDHSKLLVYRDGKVSEDRFYHIGDYIAPHSLLVYNNTRVIQARLEFHKSSGARIEVFCLEPLAPHDYQLSLGATTGCTWKCMVGNAKKFNVESLELRVERLEILYAVGVLPMPPYLNRKTEESDKRTYQTVYSRIKGSVAAPTAGLHFTERVLDDIRSRGIETEELTLHVGAGTFLPVKTADANEHTMHTEIIAVPKKAIEHIIQKLGAIVAVGTTSMRTLESLYFIGAKLRNADISEYRETEIHVGQFEPYEQEYSLSTKEALQAIVDYLNATGQETLHAETQIMIKPGYAFRVVDQLITNFHQPQSTLLLLVSAFVHGDWKTIYDYALSHDFRFLSYGDSSILTR